MGKWEKEWRGVDVSFPHYRSSWKTPGLDGVMRMDDMRKTEWLHNYFSPVSSARKDYSDGKE